jgi:xanthine dehydrogenase small subunit
MRDGKLNTRILPLEDFYIAYQKKAWEPDEVLTQILLPLPQPNNIFRTYKVAKRFDSDISAVCGAYAIKLDGGKISACRIAYGGMAATSKRATQTEAVLHGKEWNEVTVQAGMQTMQNDYQPLSDMRSSAAYRLSVAQNLLYRFYLESRLQQPLAAHQVSVFEYVSELAGE